MNESNPDIPTARGRIIKRGGVSTSVRAKSVSSSQSAIGIEPARPKTHPSIAPNRRNGVTLFVVMPLLFFLSAAFTWTRPLGANEVVIAAVDAPLSDRYYSIGSELAGRFSAEVRGTILPTPSKSVPPRTALATQPLVKQVSVAARGPQSVPAPRKDALEKQVYKILKKHGKPTHNGKELASAIVKEAIAQDYDPVFVAAVIKSESAFNALARSHKGAQGLMQIMPRTGAWLAERNDIPRGKLTDPGHNLKLGIAYLKQLEAEYHGNRMLTLVAYNWGPGHVESATKGSRRVPGEVMQYAVKILNDYRRWSSELRSSVG